MSFILTLSMSMIFRSIASLSRTLTQALAPAAILVLGLVIYTGFAIPVSNMPGWSRWINYIDPIAYGFESLMINEFTGREFSCSVVIPSGPGYDTVEATQQVCQTPGSTAGSFVVGGDAYIGTVYQYEAIHKWRNIGIVFIFIVFFAIVYLTATGENSTLVSNPG